MKTILTILFCSVLFLPVFSKNEKADTASASSSTMNNTKINEILSSICDSVKGVKGNWQVVYKNRYLFIITDETHNRMRIITPVIQEKKLKRKDLKTILQADFDRALDAKYALYNEYLWSAFVHPLGELSIAQFKDAMNQVVQLANTFGTTYSSTDLIFGGGK